MHAPRGRRSARHRPLPRRPRGPWRTSPEMLRPRQPGPARVTSGWQACPSSEGRTAASRGGSRPRPRLEHNASLQRTAQVRSEGAGSPQSARCGVGQPGLRDACRAMDAGRRLTRWSCVRYRNRAEAAVIASATGRFVCASAERSWFEHDGAGAPFGCLRERFRGFCERIAGSDVDAELALGERCG